MRYERVLPGSSEDWLRHALSDLELAQVERHGAILLEDLCFHAQQATEKAFKAVLVAYNIAAPRTHNLRTLLDTLPVEAVTSVDVQAAVALTDYAVSARYPGDLEPVDEQEYFEAIHLAQAVIDWAQALILSKRPRTENGEPGAVQSFREADH